MPQMVDDLTDDPFAGHVRLNFATSPAILAETVKAMVG
jgi:bifunctional pyridoxal-dependent enzyme with beta-cystathionase and maltose regulon repressor activities